MARRTRTPFTVPQPPVLAQDLEVGVPAGPPPVVPPCRFLREIRSGAVHVYTEAMARRGDLVEACDAPVVLGRSASGEDANPDLTKGAPDVAFEAAA